MNDLFLLPKHTLFIFAKINLYKTFCKSVILREPLFVSIKYSVISIMFRSIEKKINLALEN